MTEEEKAKIAADQKAFDDAYLIVNGTPQHNSILKNHAEVYLKAKEDELGRTAMGKAWNMVDTAGVEAGLEAKPDNMTTSQYFAHIGKSYLTTKEELKELRDSSGKEKTQADKDKDALYASRLQAAQKETTTAKNELANEKAKGKRQEISGELFSGANTVGFNPSMTDPDLRAIKKARIDAVIANSKEVGGKIIYYDTDGKEFEKGGGLPMSAKEVGAFIFADLAFNKIPGGDADGNDGKQETKVEGDIWAIPDKSEYKTFAEFNAGFKKAMGLIGLTRRDEKYNLKLTATYKHHYPDGLPD